jgi:protein SCO1/2
MKKVVVFFLLIFLFKVSFANNLEIGSHFVLTNQDNQIFDSKKIDQKYLLVFFGYGHCPSVCPTALNDLTNVIKNDALILKIAQPVFISLDPKVDTPEELKKFQEKFDKNIIMLTSTTKDLKNGENEESKIKDLSQKYKLYSNKTKTDQEEIGYIIDHSAFFYLIDKNSGKYVAHSASDPDSLKILFRENR